MKETVNNVEEVPAVNIIEEPELVIETITGIVTAKNGLNIRTKPVVANNLASEIPLPYKSEVIIDMDNSTKEFYKVCTASGLEGFCMKKFIRVNP